MSDQNYTETRTHLEEAVLNYRVRSFLDREVTLLDSFRLDEWLDLVTESVEIRVPVRTGREAGSAQSEFSSENHHLVVDYVDLKERVERLDKEYAWAENPRSRIRHFITNVSLQDVSKSEIVVTNNQLTFRGRGVDGTPDLIAARRETTLKRENGTFMIEDREVRFDHTRLPTRNLTIPLL